MEHNGRQQILRDALNVHRQVHAEARQHRTDDNWVGRHHEVWWKYAEIWVGNRKARHRTANILVTSTLITHVRRLHLGHGPAAAKLDSNDRRAACRARCAVRCCPLARRVRAKVAHVNAERVQMRLHGWRRKKPGKKLAEAIVLLAARKEEW